MEDGSDRASVFELQLIMVLSVNICPGHNAIEEEKVEIKWGEIVKHKGNVTSDDKELAGFKFILEGISHKNSTTSQPPTSLDQQS